MDPHDRSRRADRGPDLRRALRRARWGIIHRDLKPENIFLIARGTNPDFVKVVDFGISKFKDAEGKGMTGTGVMIGTPLFMSPEQIEGHKDIDQRADLYSMGVILFTMLTGRVPIDAQSIPRLVYLVCVVKAPSVREFREDIPAALDALIARLLEKDRALRFPDAASLRAELEPWLAIDTPVGPMLSPSPSAPSGIRSVPGAVSSPDTLGATGIQETPAPLQQPTPAPDALLRPMPPLVPTAVAAEVSRTPRVEVMMGLTAALVLLSIGVGVAINSLNKSTPPIVTPPVVTPVAPTARPAEPVASEPASAAPPVASAAPREVHVTLRVQPEDAELWMDGSRVLTPYDGTLDVGAHDLEVRRDGYRTLVLRRVAIRNPQTIEFRLQARARSQQ
nr:protein kinase [Deltaproteobacteria bacterium]